MSTKPKTPLKPLDEALQQLLETVTPIEATETLGLLQAHGRVLAADVVAQMAVPGFDNSAMDGYAFALDDLAMSEGGSLPMSQRVPAGSAPEPLQRGTCVRIFTGAPMPEGADTVVMQEDCVVREEQVRINGEPKRGQMVRRRGEDIDVGDVILHAGTTLTSADLGLIASLGQAEVVVRRRIKVALFSTGNELKMPGEVAPADMPPGAIYNSNRYFLHNLLQQLGCEVTDLGVVADDLAATQAALRSAAQDHDVLLTSGGVSVGEEDHVKPAVEARGALDLWAIAIKPGKPFAHGRINRSDGSWAHFIGLPGNPVSSYVTFAVLVRPLVRKLQGAQRWTVTPMSLQANFDWPKPDSRREFLRVRRNASGGLDLYPNQGSGVLTSLAWADGFVDNPPGRSIQSGDAVRFISMAQLFGAESH
jgi:molybdopterin molybdotransferase